MRYWHDEGVIWKYFFLFVNHLEFNFESKNMKSNERKKISEGPDWLRKDSLHMLKALPKSGEYLNISKMIIINFKTLSICSYN